MSNEPLDLEAIRERLDAAFYDQGIVPTTDVVALLAEVERLREEVAVFKNGNLYLGHIALEHELRERAEAAEAAEAAGGFCEKHRLNGGARNCVICGLEEMSSALSRIDYIAEGKPNDMQVSTYDVAADPELVVKHVQEQQAKVQALLEVVGAAQYYLDHGESHRYVLAQALEDYDTKLGVVETEVQS